MTPRRVTLFVALTASLMAAITGSAEPLHDPASPLIVEQWVKGGPLMLAEGLGKQHYVVFFFGTWCPHCRRAIPVLSDMQQRYRDLGVTFVGVTIESEVKVRAFLNDPKWKDKTDFAVGLDAAGATSAAYMTTYGDPGIPYAFLIDRTGTIVWRGHPLKGLERRIHMLVPGAASRPMSEMPPPVGASTRPAIVIRSPEPPQGMVFDKQVRVPISASWRSRFAPGQDVAEWLATRVTLPLTAVTTAGGPTGSAWQTIRWSAGDWTLLSGTGWRVAAAGYGNEQEFSGMAECSGVVTREATPRVMATSFQPWTGVGPAVAPISAAASSQPATITPPMPLGPLQTGRITCWVYFPMTRAQAADKTGTALRFRDKAPIRPMTASSAPSK